MAMAGRDGARKQAKLESWWWQAEPDPSATPSAVANARHRALQEQLLHFDQNAWLTKHAKHPRFQFSGEQKRMLRQWFDALDTDGSGKISVEELEDPMLSIGIVNDTREIEQIVNKLDKDSNGQIDFQEFVDFLTPHTRHNKGSNPQKHEVMFHQLTKKMEMTGTTQVATSAATKSSFFRGIQPTPVGSPGASAKKILQTRRASDPALTSNNNNQEPLPEEAQSLKDLLLSAPSQYQRSRFSFLKLKRVVVPPVQIPPELAAPNAINNIVAGSKIPMTKAMWKRHRARMMRRLPGRIDERVAW
ncbi:hypothetical protein JG688_00003439 [Phytophthora aleatoria]|uniref:EF-hand domain-containing protein n=1 Tax=Phytophthora aleatoria TaxID=2496075 RepID=A0A8J5JBB4_9STRA|nr:hypothetical protein JG688_00003439 [Phytophthora aleatoria]